MLLPELTTMNPPLDPGHNPFTEVTIPSDHAEARRVQDTIEQQLHACPISEQEIFGLRLALEEALVNAIKHGNQMDRGKQVHIAYRLLGDRFEIRIVDEGSGFDPSDVPDPTAIENLDRPCGRGLMLMRHYMSHVEYNERGNAVFMVKTFKRK